jgi:DNA-binding NtrC family response regulator
LPATDGDQAAARRPRIALIGADRRLLEVWVGDLQRPCDILLLDEPDRAVRRAEGERFDILVVDLDFDTGDGLGLLGRLRRARPTAETVVVSDAVPAELIVRAMRLGASDFLCKPLPSGELARRLADVLARVERADPRPTSAVEMLHGESPAIQHVRKLIIRLADSNLPVLLLGPSGTGKELAARALHATSSRASAEFVAINCAGLSEALIDSELFGHERGAFTGAQTSHRGLFDHADGGTLFLDEIGDMPPQTQVRLLRALQEGEVRPVGATRAHHVDVRVISATNVDLTKAVAAGRFRQDLYFRLGPIKLELPTLRTRGRDIEILAHRLLADSAALARRRPPRLSDEVTQALLRYPWPGNVRELKSAIEYALSLARGDTIEMEDLPPSVGGATHVDTSMTPDPPDADLPGPNYMQERRQLLADFDRRYFERLLRHTRGNLSEAARRSGVDRSNLRRVLKDIGLDPLEFRPR